MSFGRDGLGGSRGIGVMGFLPGVSEAGGRGLVGGGLGGVMNPGVPGGGDGAGIFVFFVVDDPSAGVAGIFWGFFFKVAVVQRVASDGATVQEGLEKDCGGRHGGECSRVCS